MAYNVPYPYIIRWATLTSGRTGNNRTFGDAEFWNRKFLQYHKSGIAFSQLDQLVGNTSTGFAEWLKHPTQDDFWAACTPTSGEYSKIDLPILTITGYYDGDQPGAMAYYRRHMASDSAKAKERHYLLLGPWDHSGTRNPKQEFGGLKFGDAMMFDAFALDKDWYQWTMANGQRPAFIKDRVTYFVAGNNEWKSADSLDAVADHKMVFSLNSSGYAGDVFRSGSLSRQQIKTTNVDQYVYDPLNTEKAERKPVDAHITDQSEIVMTNGDGLIYHSDPFEEATEISGYIRFEAWIEMNVKDTDIAVTLYEIAADGASILLTGETQRARYRESLKREQIIEPGEVNLFTFERFHFFSRLVAKGSRLRLFIRPANTLQNQRNYNSGKTVSLETKADAQTAIVKLHHGPEYRSRLILPVVKRE